MSPTLLALGARRRTSVQAEQPEDEFEVTDGMLEDLRTVADDAGMAIEEGSQQGEPAVLRLVPVLAPSQEVPPAVPSSCVHVWDCLRGRTHNRGRGKYKCYLCRHCGAFQRR